MASLVCALLFLAFRPPLSTEDDPRRQCGQDREVRAPSLASAETVLRWCPRGDRLLDWQIGDNWVLSPIVGPIYSPETEFGLVLGGVATFSTQPKKEALPRSTISLFFIPTSNDTISLASEGFAHSELRCRR